jgi:hypothetical protein
MVCCKLYVILTFFPFITPTDKQTDIENYWRQRHYNVAIKNNKLNFEDLNIHHEHITSITVSPIEQAAILVMYGAVVVLIVL